MAKPVARWGLEFTVSPGGLSSARPAIVSHILVQDTGSLSASDFIL